MMSLPDFKALLGTYGDTLSDQQITELRAFEYQLADAIIERWRRREHPEEEPSAE